MRHLLDTTDLSLDEIDNIIATAIDIINNKEKYSHICDGKKLATLFFEPSTRTRLSFEAAMMELGGNVLGFSNAGSSSATKGETVEDTVRMVSCYADIIAMRHPLEGAPRVASFKSGVPIINAGDGGHSHPTQTLADLLTIFREKGRLDNMTVGLCGDLKFGRTVHSLIKAMSRYSNVKFILIAPKELAIPDYIKTDILDKSSSEYKEVETMEEVMPQLDVLYMTRVQRERFFSEDEYLKVKDAFILDLEKLNTAKEDLTIMHPLPRVNEIATEVDDDPRAKYFVQALNGKYVRMALIKTLLEWAGTL
jgi:aspartate carbamoyltransferase catalytic subunit